MKAIVQFPTLNVCSGSEAAKLGQSLHVRFTPDSDEIADIAGGPFRANGRRDQAQRDGILS